MMSLIVAVGLSAAQNPPLPAGADGMPSGSVTCTGVCRDTHQLASTRIEQSWSRGGGWAQWWFGAGGSPADAMKRGVVVTQWERKVEARYGSCVCGCVVQDHVCGGSYCAWARWTAVCAREMTYAEWLEASQGGGPGGMWTIRSQETGPGSCNCCAPTPAAGGGARPETPAAGAGGTAAGAKPGSGGGSGPVVGTEPKPKPQEEPGPGPGMPVPVPGSGSGWQFGGGLGLGLADGDEIDGTSAAGELDLQYRGLFNGPVYVFAQAVFTFAEIETESVDTSIPFRPVTVSEEEDLTIISLALGAGYSYAVAPNVTIFGQVGMGRFFVSGADGVNGHIAGHIAVGASYAVSTAVSLAFKTGLSIGSADVHAGDGEGELKSVLAVTVGVDVRW